MLKGVSRPSIMCRWIVIFRRFSALYLALKGKPMKEGMLAVKGIGKEPVDSMLFYGFGAPKNPVDAYSFRTFWGCRVRGGSWLLMTGDIFLQEMVDDKKMHKEMRALLA